MLNLPERLFDQLGSFVSNILVCRSLGLPVRWRRPAPITARTVNDSRAVRGTKTRWVLERKSGGLTRKPSAILRERSLGIMPSSTSLSLNLSFTHNPSVRGRVVKVLRL